VDFKQFAQKVHESRDTMEQFHINEAYITLCFDPGHTTGYARFDGYKLTGFGELVTKPIEAAVITLQDAMALAEPDTVVMESYTVYQWKAQQHGGSELLTARVIGCIETLCVQQFIPRIIKQPAHIAKGFCKDSKLKQWGLYQPGMRHARDAIRHGCYYLLFGAINRKEAQGHTVG